MAESEAKGIFHIWSFDDGNVLCGIDLPRVILQPDWARRVDPKGDLRFVLS
jgi:hypothetical protein